MQGRICRHFLEIIWADIVFKFCRYTHLRINRGRGAITFKGGSKRAKWCHALKAPENGTKSTYSSIWQETKATFIDKSLVFITCCVVSKRNQITFQILGYLFEIRPLPKPCLWIRHWWPFHFPSKCLQKEMCGTSFHPWAGLCNSRTADSRALGYASLAPRFNFQTHRYEVFFKLVVIHTI